MDLPHHKDHFRIIRYKVSLVYCLNFPNVGILHNKSAYTPHHTHTHTTPHHTHTTPHHTHTHSEASIQKEAVLSDEDPPYSAPGCAAEKQAARVREACSPGKTVLKIEHLVTCLATNLATLAAPCVLPFSVLAVTNFYPFLNFTLAACSYAIIANKFVLGHNDSRTIVINNLCTCPPRQPGNGHAKSTLSV